MLPLPLVMIPTARMSPSLAARVGFRRVAPVGLLITAVGFLVLSRLQADSSYLLFLAGVVLFGFGMGLAGTPGTTAVTSSLPISKQGVASAVNDTARELGSAFGIAVLGALLNQTYRDTLAPGVAAFPEQMRDRLLASIAVTASPAVANAGAAGKAVIAEAQAAFVAGVSNAVLVAAAVLAITAVAVFMLAGREGSSESSRERAEGLPVASTAR